MLKEERAVDLAISPYETGRFYSCGQWPEAKKFLDLNA